MFCCTMLVTMSKSQWRELVLKRQFPSSYSKDVFHEPRMMFVRNDSKKKKAFEISLLRVWQNIIWDRAREKQTNRYGGIIRPFTSGFQHLYTASKNGS